MYFVELSSESVFRLSNLSKTNSVARMAINPGIPIPSAMPRVSLERPFNGADDGEDEDVGGSMADDVICEDNSVVANDIADGDAKLDKVVVELSGGKILIAGDAVKNAVLWVPSMSTDKENKNINAFVNARLNL